MTGHEVEVAELDAFLARFGTLRVFQTTDLIADELFAQMHADVHQLTEKAPVETPAPIEAIVPEPTAESQETTTESVDVAKETTAPSPATTQPVPVNPKDVIRVMSVPLTSTVGKMLNELWKTTEEDFNVVGRQVLRSLR